MPMANVTRIMRKVLPAHAKVSDEAKEIMQECVSEFISFITGEANDRCRNEQRKTITAEDLLFAMNNLGFDDYIEPLTKYLHHYREYDDNQRGLLRAEPTKAADSVNYGNATFAPFVANHHIFSRSSSMNGFLNDPSGAGPTQVDLANCYTPFVADHQIFSRPASTKGFMNGPLGIGPSTVVTSNLDPFAQGEEVIESG